MPSLAEHHSDTLVKLLLIGDSKSGKTSALVSLVKAGYKLYILDLDNLLDVLAMLVQKECPDKAVNVQYRTLRDKYVASPTGPIIQGIANAYMNTLKMLDDWKFKDGEEEINFGKTAALGSDSIVVIDSLSRMCDYAYQWQLQLTPVGKGKEDGRAVFFNAQQHVEKTISLLTSPAFATNVIVIAHILYQDQPDGTRKGFPQGVGQALSPKIPQYFPAYALAEKKGDKRVLRTTSTALIDLANPKPFEMGQSYPLETGLAQYFEVLRGPLEQEKK